MSILISIIIIIMCIIVISRMFLLDSSILCHLSIRLLILIIIMRIVIISMFFASYYYFGYEYVSFLLLGRCKLSVMFTSNLLLFIYFHACKVFDTGQDMPKYFGNLQKEKMYPKERVQS